MRLDVYRAEPRRPDGELRPAVVQVHGGGWIFGSRREQGIPLLNHLAANGWVGFNVDYRLSPRATLPDHVIDVKRAIAWVREHADEYGVDPERICLTGGSAGGHLGGARGADRERPRAPAGLRGRRHLGRGRGPVLRALRPARPGAAATTPGIRDWLLEELVFKRPPSDDPDAFRARLADPSRARRTRRRSWSSTASTTRWFRSRTRASSSRALEAVSESPVRYVELPGAEHAFDIFPSLRTARVVEGIERFLRAVVKPPGTSPMGSRRSGPTRAPSSPPHDPCDPPRR